MVLGGTPACRAKSSSRRAVRHSPSREHAAMAAEKVIVSGGMPSERILRSSFSASFHLPHDFITLMAALYVT
eukprot:scaffold20876_cov51-Isochrysis_galbana.AAC.1